MKKRTVNWHVLTLGAAAVAIILSYCSNALAQSGGDQARQARIAELKTKIAKLQDHLKKAESEGRNSAVATNGGGTKNPGDCCASGAAGKTSSTNGSPDHPAGKMAQAGGGEPSPSGEHPMGGGMGGMEGEMGGGGTMGGASASPQASPGMPMEEHMKGMEHMHGMMHGGQASPGVSPGEMEHGMPMGHPMGGMGAGGMGGGGMGGEGMQGGGTGGGAQPQASPSSGMGGGTHDDM